MAKHRELASVMYDSTLGRTSASKIWRTVVFAGAMLAAPMSIGCGGKKPEPTTPDKGAGGGGGEGDKAATDKAAADKAAADQAAADQAAADKAAADEAAAKKKRPRGGGERPTGRGFVLA